MRGSETNLLELRLAEAAARRASSRGKNSHGLLDPLALDAASRQVAEDALEVLRQLATAMPPAFKSSLKRVADAIEPVLLSVEIDERGRRLSHEQYAWQVLAPRLHDAMERAADAREDADYALKELARAKARNRTVQSELESQLPSLRSMEARKQALEIELHGLTRVHAETLAENLELTSRLQVAEGDAPDPPWTPPLTPP